MILNVNNETILEYLKWMEYIPKYWNIERINTKKIWDLSDSEKKILKLIELEKKHISNFKKVLTDDKIEKELILKVINHINKISIDEYANIKLSKEELEYCKSVAIIYMKNDIDLSIQTLKRQENRNMKEEYILYLLKKRKINNLDNKIKIKKMTNKV